MKEYCIKLVLVGYLTQTTNLVQQLHAWIITGERIQ